MLETDLGFAFSLCQVGCASHIYFTIFGKLGSQLMCFLPAAHF